VLLVILLVIKACTEDDGLRSGSYGSRTSGGSFGGYSGGGGHK
jgi:hypothetical protein